MLCDELCTRANFHITVAIFICHIKPGTPIFQQIPGTFVAKFRHTCSCVMYTQANKDGHRKVVTKFACVDAA